MIRNKQNIDYLAEVIVSHLISNKEIDDNRLIVRMMGVFARFFSKDVEKIKPIRSGKGEKRWEIFIHREGMYDILPEGFFHSNSGKYFKNKKETLSQFKRHRHEEKSARQFFLPFEQEFFKYRINKEQFEQNFFYSPEAVKEFIDFFNLHHLDLNTYQKSSLFFIVPHIPKIVGNLSLTETCFEIILQENVKIMEAHNPQEKSHGFHLSELGAYTLGYDSILGRSFSDNNPGIHITIGPLYNRGDLISYLSGKKKKVLERLIELFIQADLDISREFVLKPEDQPFVLSNEDYGNRLSYSTMI